MKLKLSSKKFEELSLTELYAILQLRSEIFVVEQNCVYQDIDGKDAEALHIIGKKDGKIVAYARCFAPGFYFQEAAIGRVLVSEKERKQEFAHQLMEASLQAIKEVYQTTTVKLSAQQYLTKFYEKHGFVITGKGYLEDGIPHIAMRKEK